MNQELKVGIVVSLGLIIFAGLIVGVGGVKFGEKGYRIKVLFNYVSGLDNHAPVRLAGMECGEVKKMRLKGSQVEVDIWLKEEAKVYEDAVITINMLGLLGEAYIEIDPGDKGVCLKDQDVITGKDPIQVSEILLKGEKIAKKLDRAMSKIDNMLGGEGSKADIKGVVENIKELTLNLNGLVTENKDNVNKTFKDIEKTLSHLNEGADKISKGFGSLEKRSGKVLEEMEQILAENREGIKGATLGIEKGAKKFNQVLSNLDKAVTESKTNVGETLAGFNQTVKELKVTLDSVRDLVGQVEKGEGVLSKIFHDEEMGKNLAEAIEHLNNLAADLEENPWKLMRKK
ncbi:MCE family protein [bacterium]|nr:MCE family protein [bacterium]MBU1615580.1 MCE family protein [bacterium]